MAHHDPEPTIHLWDADGTPRAVITGTGMVDNLAVSPDGSWLAAGTGHGAVHLWNTDGTARGVLTGHVDKVAGVAVSPDGRWLATSGRDKTLRLWDTATLRCVTYLRVDSALGRLTWFPSGDRLAVCGDLGLYVFDVRT
ncbi:hypothetical protein GCM10027091_49590 [Streptomyces daliensis]